MNKGQRHIKIRDLITNNEIETQDELVERLKSEGYNVTENMKYAKKTKGPVLIHVITKKGKGYEPAENDALGTWHGLGPYKMESGEVVKKPGPPSYSGVPFIMRSIKPIL